MLTTIFLLFSSIRDGLRTPAGLQAEILALRHQLLVLQRSSRDRRLRLGHPDRLLWVWLSRFWNRWRSALLIVKPETVIAWHRQGFRLYWRWKSRHPVGRPSLSREVIDLIHKMSLANPRWGAPRIHGELLKLGFELSQARLPSIWCVFESRLLRLGGHFFRTMQRTWSLPTSLWCQQFSSTCCLSS